MVYSLYNYNMYIHKSYICTYINGLQGFFFFIILISQSKKITTNYPTSQFLMRAENGDYRRGAHLQQFRHP